MTAGKVTTWLHMSDFHIFETDACRRLFMTQIFNFFKDPEAPKIDFITITGDFHHHQDIEENDNKCGNYQYTIEFLNKLVEQLGIEKKNVFMIPGNHDISFKEWEKDKGNLLEKEEELETTVTYKDGVTATEKKKVRVYKDIPTGDAVDENNNWAYLALSERYKFFNNYKKFIHLFYGDTENPYGDIASYPEKTCIRYYTEPIAHEGKEKKVLGILHFNTALERDKSIKNGKTLHKLDVDLEKKIVKDIGINHISTNDRGEKELSMSTDVLTLTEPQSDFTIDSSIPTIAIGHHKFSDLNDKTREELTAYFEDQTHPVSAYLCGDAHIKHVCYCGYQNYKSDIPMFCCPKTSADNNDNYSQFGFIIYTWDHDKNTVEVIPYNWVPDLIGIRASSEFKPGIYREYAFTMKNRVVNNSLNKIEYINPRNKIKSNDLYSDKIAKVLGVIKKSIDNKNKKLVVIGDVMLDHYMGCDATKISQSQRHDANSDFSLISEKERESLRVNFDEQYIPEIERKLLGGAANVASACQKTVDTVDVFGIIGSDGEGKELLAKCEEIFNKNGGNHVHLAKIDKYITITKIYNECISRNKINKDKLEIGTIRVNRELTESDAENLLKSTIGLLCIAREKLSVSEIQDILQENEDVPDSSKKKIAEELNELKSWFSSADKVVNTWLDSWLDSWLEEHNNTVPKNSPIFMDKLEELVGLKRWIEEFICAINNANGVIIKDHEKGLLSSVTMLNLIIGIINGKINTDNNFIVALDPKYSWDKYKPLKRIDIALPNVKELATLLYPGKDSADIWAERERNHCLFDEDLNILTGINIKDNEGQKWWNENIRCIAVTEDKKGASLYIPNSNINKNSSYPDIESIGTVEVIDPIKGAEIGCGDVFDAFFVGGLLNKDEIFSNLYTNNDVNDEILYDLYRILIRLANYAARRKMLDKEGSRVVTINEVGKDLYMDSC